MLIGNGRLTDKIPMSFLGRDWNAQLQPARLAGLSLSDNFGALAGIPRGYYMPHGWMLPRKAGALSSLYIAGLSVPASGSGAMGINIEGDAVVTVTTNTPAGQLISSGTGSATFSLTTTGNVLASLSGVGSASMAFATNTPAMSASGWAAASGAFSVTGNLTSYARGLMVGSTLTGGALTEASIIAAFNANPPAVNIKKVNDVDVTGTGEPGTEWGPA